jgi:ferredoxin
VLVAEVPIDQLENAREAFTACPARAIVIEED